MIALGAAGVGEEMTTQVSTNKHPRVADPGELVPRRLSRQVIIVLKPHSPRDQERLSFKMKKSTIGHIRNRPADAAPAVVPTLFGTLAQAALGAPNDRLEAAILVLNGEANIFCAAEKSVGTETYLNLRQLSNQIGISPSTLWRYRIPGHEMGGHPKYKRSEVEAYLASETFKRRAASLRAERRNPLPNGNANN